MTLGSLFQSHASEYYRVSTAGPLHYPTPETGGPMFGRDTVWDKYVDETRNDEQISDGGVLRTGVFRKSLVRGGTGAEISCSSTSTSSARPISCKKHKSIPAVFLLRVYSRRPGQRQLARRALQSENQGTKATQPPTTTEMGNPHPNVGRITGVNCGRSGLRGSL